MKNMFILIGIMSYLTNYCSTVVRHMPNGSTCVIEPEKIVAYMDRKATDETVNHDVFNAIKARGWSIDKKSAKTITKSSDTERFWRRKTWGLWEEINRTARCLMCYKVYTYHWKWSDIDGDQ